jgi:hypothetical protein
MKILKSMVAGLCLMAGLLERSAAVMFLDTADITHNTSTPGDNSGWQYEGKFRTELGVPIAPYFFIGAAHLTANVVGDVFDFHGDSYTTIAKHDILDANNKPLTDLRIWEVHHSKPFPTYAPLSSGLSDIGGVATIIGRGTRKGNPILLGQLLKGWVWGNTDNVERWGRNIVVGGLNDPTYGSLLYCDFDNPGIADECHLSVGDSGGGMFVLEDGLWRLAGINLAVDGPFRTSPGGTDLNGPFFDLGGLYVKNGTVWELIPDGIPNIPSSFYCSRISAYLPQILQITGGNGSLAPESFVAWQKLYFSPAQIATPLTTGALGDFDTDGFSNLLEFAFNLDPSFNERAEMIAGSGLRGLPLVRRETLSGAERLTVEFVRRTVSSGASLTYNPQFSSDMSVWEAVGTVTVTAINPRWERVKVVDSLTIGDTPKRFSRVKVNLTE